MSSINSLSSINCRNWDFDRWFWGYRG